MNSKAEELKKELEAAGVRVTMDARWVSWWLMLAEAAGLCLTPG
jgi:hypothetical protein